MKILCRGPYIDSFCQVWFHLAQLFQRSRLKYEKVNGQTTNAKWWQYLTWPFGSGELKKETITYDVGNRGPGLRQAQAIDRVKPLITGFWKYADIYKAVTTKKTVMKYNPSHNSQLTGIHFSPKKNFHTQKNSFCSTTREKFLKGYSSTQLLFLLL